MIEEIHENDTILRKFEYNSKTIIQIQYTGWPDHGVPEDLELFNNFIIKCKKMIYSNRGTVVVHCR